MKQITLNIPDSKYSFFIELVKNLGLEKVKIQSSDSIEEKKEPNSGVPSLRGKLHLSKKQYQDFQNQIKDSRNEWNRSI